MSFISYSTYLFELSENNTLYHRSFKEMAPGEIIKPSTKETGEHTYLNTPFEYALEEYRKDNFPDRPSRLNSIYSSITPRSRFQSKGFLYEVQPLGKMFMTNSQLIDEMGMTYERELYDRIEQGWYGRDIEYNSQLLKKAKEGDERARQDLIDILDYPYEYWKGTEKSNKKVLEVLSESARVIRKVEEPKQLIKDDKVIVSKDGLIGDCHIIFNSVYKREKNPEVPTEKEMKLITDFMHEMYFPSIPKPEIKLDKYHENEYNVSFSGPLKKGSLLLIKHTDFIGSKNFDNPKEGKYNRLMVAPFISDRYLLSKNITVEFNINKYENKNIFNFEDYLSKENK
jgi:hypothetical protein